MLRFLSIFLLAIVFSACSTSHKKRSYNKKYSKYSKNSKNKKKYKDKLVGKKGYFTRPAIFATPEDQRSFNTCKPFKVIAVKLKKTRVIIKIKQKGKIINVVGLNRKNFKRHSLSHSVLMDYYFTKKPKVIKRAKKVASVKNKLCKGQNWNKMSMAQFLFVNGDPEMIKKGAGNYANVDQWIYKTNQYNPPKSYYFSAKRLYSWK